MSSPTERSLELLRREGWVPGIVERHNTFARKKFDLLGVIDVVAVRSGKENRLIAPTSALFPVPGDGETMGVQACAGSGGDSAARVAKILAEWRVLVWLLAGNRLEVWSWAKRSGGVRGGKKVWAVRCVAIKLGDPGVNEALRAAVEKAWKDGGIRGREARAAFPPDLWRPAFEAARVLAAHATPAV